MAVTPDPDARSEAFPRQGASPAGPRRRRVTLRERLMGVAAEAFFRGLSSAGRLHPLSRPEVHDVQVLKDVAYSARGHARHRLDVYRPAAASGPRPVVVYLHGGGFRHLAKDTHWVMGLLYARAGYVVFNVGYRLAPRHPFPAALEDASEALRWLKDHAAEYGGDLQRLVLAGESAGANLAASLALGCCYRRPEPFARALFDAGLRPSALVLGCGILQVSDPGRFARRRPLPRWIRHLLDDISRGYLGDAVADAELADPLRVLERGDPPDRPLPPTFGFCGTRDPILDDTRRLAPALARLGVPHQVRIYPGQLHAFHAVPLLPAARDCWRDTFAFLRDHVPADALRPARSTS